MTGKELCTKYIVIINQGTYRTATPMGYKTIVIQLWYLYWTV